VGLPAALATARVDISAPSNSSSSAPAPVKSFRSFRRSLVTRRRMAESSRRGWFYWIRKSPRLSVTSPRTLNEEMDAMSP
jgi:hypothetical protein